MAERKYSMDRTARLFRNRRTIVLKTTAVVLCDKDCGREYWSSHRLLKCHGNTFHGDDRWIVYRVEDYDPDDLSRGVIGTFSTWREAATLAHTVDVGGMTHG